MSAAHYTNVNAEQEVGLVLFKGQGLQKYTHLYVYELNLEKIFFLSSKRKDQISEPFTSTLFFLLNWIRKAAKMKVGRRKKPVKRKTMNQYE